MGLLVSGFGVRGFISEISTARLCRAAEKNSGEGVVKFFVTSCFQTCAEPCRAIRKALWLFCCKGGDSSTCDGECKSLRHLSRRRESLVRGPQASHASQPLHAHFEGREHVGMSGGLFPPRARRRSAPKDFRCQAGRCPEEWSSRAWARNEQKEHEAMVPRWCICLRYVPLARAPSVGSTAGLPQENCTSDQPSLHLRIADCNLVGFGGIVRSKSLAKYGRLCSIMFHPHRQAAICCRPVAFASVP